MKLSIVGLLFLCISCAQNSSLELEDQSTSSSEFKREKGSTPNNDEQNETNTLNNNESTSPPSAPQNSNPPITSTPPTPTPSPKPTPEPPSTEPENNEPQMPASLCNNAAVTQSYTIQFEPQLRNGTYCNWNSSGNKSPNPGIISGRGFDTVNVTDIPVSATICDIKIQGSGEVQYQDSMYFLINNYIVASDDSDLSLEMPSSTMSTAGEAYRFDWHQVVDSPIPTQTTPYCVGDSECTWNRLGEWSLSDYKIDSKTTVELIQMTGQNALKFQFVSAGDGSANNDCSFSSFSMDVEVSFEP